MNRRTFVAALASAATTWPPASRAQHAAVRSRKLGVLHPGQAAAVNARITAIHEGLSDPSAQRFETELVIRLADGDQSRLPALAADLVNGTVDAIIAAGPPAVQAARGATKVIPVIAIDLESDPIASGWVGSLARPGGNVTGVFLDFPDFGAKCLQILIEFAPAFGRIGVLWDPTTGSLRLRGSRDCRTGDEIDVKVFEARRVADIADAFYALEYARIRSMLVLSSPLFGAVTRNWSLTSPFAERWRRSRCFQISQDKRDYSRMGQTFRAFIVRRELWPERC